MWSAVRLAKKNPDLAKHLAEAGTRQVVQVAGNKLVLFASSDAVYGNEVSGLCQVDAVCNPGSLYGQLKLQAEQIIMQCAKPCIFRIPSNFGPSANMRWDNIVHFFARRMYETGEMDVSDPEVTRTLIDVRDAANAFAFACFMQPGCAGQIMHIASGCWTKLEIAQTAAEVIGGRAYCDDQFIDPDTRDFILDCTAMQNLGWKPAYTLADGIRALTKIMDEDPNIQKFQS